MPGKKGEIHKIVSFSETEIDKTYNLAFGDLGEDGEFDDLSVSGNGDRDRVLATVVNIVTSYTTRYPDRWIAFRGITESRTRLYRMAISLHLEELSIQFDIYALAEEQLVPFTKELKANAFFVKI